MTCKSLFVSQFCWNSVFVLFWPSLEQSVTCIPLILCIFSVFLSFFDVFSKSNILIMIKPRKIIRPVFDRGLLWLSKNIKTFDRNRKLMEEIGLEKHHLSKKCRFGQVLSNKFLYFQYCKLNNIFSIKSICMLVYENFEELNIHTLFHKNIYITKWVILFFFQSTKKRWNNIFSKLSCSFS